MENAVTMRKNKILISFSFISTILFVLLLGNIVYALLFGKALFEIPILFGIIVIHSFLLFNGILFSEVKLKDLMPNTDLKTYLIIIGFYIGTMLVVAICFGILYFLGFPPDSYKTQDRIQEAGFMAIFFAVIVAPFSEELFFRAFLVKKTGLVASAIIFMLFHISYGSIYQLLATFIFGISLGVLYKKRGINHSILLHFMINFISLSATFLMRYFYLF